ncbi:MAG: site-specific DNA-methyltransferase [Methylobacter sp.]|nr:site-specific DNA-methyltransferase [Methylobacter sp.]
MDKLKLHSPDFTQENIAKLAELFPNCVTETREADGSLKQAIDFDQLRQELSTSIVEGPQERYQLNWPGKREALLTANAPIAKTLRPARSESVDFDSTQNLFIEGDNLDALKLLQETYLGKVKMIYIDPPYNTGKEFIYDDDFSEDTASYFQRSNQKDAAGQRMVANTETNGRFHSDWLSMMYPRLKLARNLLKDDGVIFISIDDGEVSNLRKLCDEVFGEDNFVALIIWKKRSTPPNDKVIAAQHDYILVYTKSSISGLNLRKRSDVQVARYKNPDNHSKGPWTAGDLMANVKGGRYVSSLYFPIINPRTGQEHYPSSNGNWRFNEARIKELIANDEIYFGENDEGRPKLKRFLSQVKEGITWTTLWDFAPLNTAASSEMAQIFGNLTTFENPKPVDLISHILELGGSNDAVVLDFFSGSATTAHAVMQLNAEDGGKRKFIMVQLPEACDEKSEAYKAGYPTIAEIGKERIRRAGQKIRQVGEALASTVELPKVGALGEASPTLPPPLTIDIGFRVLKIDGSNMKDVYYTPDAVQQSDLVDHVDNIREDRTAEDLLFQVLLDWGVDLTLPIVQESIAGFTVLFVDGNALAACFDTGINEAFVKELAARHPLRVVFRDAGFAGDSVKINIEQIFKLLSPNTEIKTI